jgi:hypothetical protein
MMSSANLSIYEMVSLNFTRRKLAAGKEGVIAASADTYVASILSMDEGKTIKIFAPRLRLCI